MPPRTIDVAATAAGIRERNRTDLARAITLVESRKPAHREQAQELLVELLGDAEDVGSDGEATTPTRRIGISGVPGVGKSTFIDAFGSMLTARGHRVAVLAIDPSSNRTGGSILGDKTRMARLAVDEAAFVRPSPTSGTLGGVARATREAIVLVEAAGYDVVIVETVGVGQSEVAVAGMVDCFLHLALARTGDSLQGIKKGILELVDVVAVNKAEGKHERDAKIAARELGDALRMLQADDAPWKPPVLTCSGLHETGLDAVWDAIEDHHRVLAEHGGVVARRREQAVAWIWAMVRDRLLDELHGDPAVRELTPEVEREVRDGELTPTLAADRLLGAFRGGADA